MVECLWIGISVPGSTAISIRSVRGRIAQVNVPPQPHRDLRMRRQSFTNHPSTIFQTTSSTPATKPAAGEPGPSGKPSRQRQAPIQEPAPRIQSPINHANGPHTNINIILLKNNAPPDQRSSGSIFKALWADKPRSAKMPQSAETPSRANVNALPAPTSRYPAGGSNCAGANQNFLHTILFTTPT